MSIPRNATITLDVPILIDGVEADRLTMRRPTVRDEIGFQKGKGDPGERAVRLIAALCEVAPDDLMEMDAADFGKLEAQYQAFRQGSPSGTFGEPS